MSELLYRQDLFRGRTIKVHGVDLIEAVVELEFGVSVTRMFALDIVSSAIPPADLDRAIHCLIVLAGGKRLIVQPNASDRQNWQHLPIIRSRIYLAERTHGRQVGHTANLHHEVDPVLELAPFMNWLGSRGYSTRDVKAATNGGPRV